jgi:perosamine synthetase
MIPVYKPYLSKYKEDAHKALDSEWISNYGIFVDLAAKQLKDIIGVNHCVLMNNGTSATHCLFLALKYKYPRIQKIYVPNYVFIAPINCALIEYNASQIEVLKTDPTTMNMDVSEETLLSLEKNSALIVVHNLGNIVNVERIHAIRPDVVIVEDNCEGLFGKYNGSYTGSSNATLCSAISFYANKTITTGEGGAFLTNDLELYKYIKCVYSHGMGDVRYIHENVGYNYRMTNIQASLLYSQLNDINHILNLKHNVFDRYTALFQPCIQKNQVILLETDANTEKSKWMYVITLSNFNNYDHLERYMSEKNVQVRPFFYNLNRHAHTSHLLTSDDAFNENGIMLPSYPELKHEEIKYIVNCIEEYISTYLKST